MTKIKMVSVEELIEMYPNPAKPVKLTADDILVALEIAVEEPKAGHPPKAVAADLQRLIKDVRKGVK